MRHIIFLLLLTVFSCEEATPPYELPDNAKTLLSGDSSKTWKLAGRFNNKTRMNMGNCFLSHQETYKLDMTMHDNSSEHRDCGKTLYAKWEFTKDKKGNYYIKWTSEQLPSLMNTKEDYKHFKILHLSKEQLTIQFKHKQFSSKTTTITDFYVPENVSVKDREFHW